MRQKSCAGALILCFFVSRRDFLFQIDEVVKLPSGASGPAPGQTSVTGEDINCRCFLTYRMEKKKWGLGATIGDPEAGVPLHEEPKRIKSIPVWDVRAIEKELDAFDEKAVALDHEETWSS